MGQALWARHYGGPVTMAQVLWRGSHYRGPALMPAPVTTPMQPPVTITAFSLFRPLPFYCACFEITFVFAAVQPRLHPAFFCAYQLALC